MQLTPEQMLYDNYLYSRANLLRLDQASFPAAGRPHAGGTIYLTAADESGMMISFIQSNYMRFGSGVVVPDTGITLQNRGGGFLMDPQSPNVVVGGQRTLPKTITHFQSQKATHAMTFDDMGGDGALS